MVYINPKGRDWSSTVNWDAVGKIYGSFAIAWTVILLGGMLWLIAHRRLSFLKIRNIPLAIASTTLLHVYLVKILLAYTVNGHFPCNAEYWIMSIYLPFGIALFQANLLQLHSISEQQKKFLQAQPFRGQIELSQSQRGLRKLWTQWQNMTVIRRNEILIVLGMIAQVIVTAVIYACSRKVQSSWGIPSEDITPAKCRKGWEWIPSSIWQLFLSWFYGPWILFKIRNIKDVHYWRIQTILCVIAGLPGAPLWLAALYSPKFAKVNKYWVPPMWLAPGIIMIQTVTIFFPIFEAYRSRTQRNSTLNTIKSWEEKRLQDDTNYSGSTRNSSFLSTKRAQSSSSSTTASSRRKSLYSLASLDKALVLNPSPLLHFAACKDFTGENIVFLMQVRDWRATWSRAQRDLGSVGGLTKVTLFNTALEIYVSSIHTKTAEFPVNIGSKIRAPLDALFGPTVSDRHYYPRADSNVVDPFNYPESSPATPTFTFPSRNIQPLSADMYKLSLSENTHSESDDTIAISNTEKQLSAETPSYNADLAEPSSVPAAFNENIFNEAEQSIKFLVLTNTWPRFVETCSDFDNLLGGRCP